MNSNEKIRRFLIFVIGLLSTALGVALSTKAGLGTSPISTIPYSLSLIVPKLTIGNWTIIFNMLLVAGHIIILHDEFKKPILIVREFVEQLIIMTVFGYAIDFWVFCLSAVEPEIYVLKIILLLISCVFVAFGIYLQLLSKVALLAGDLFNAAIAKVLNKEYGTIRTASDIVMSSTAAILCLVFLGALVGVREGTVIACLIVGNIINFFNRHLIKFERFILPANDHETVE